jgi:hypothetical protein
MDASAESKHDKAPAAAISTDEMADNLTVASHMATNNVLARKLQDKIRECEAEWDAASSSVEEAKKSFTEAKGMVDQWLGMWKKGEV